MCIVALAAPAPQVLSANCVWALSRWVQCPTIEKYHNYGADLKLTELDFEFAKCML